MTISGDDPLDREVMGLLSALWETRPLADRRVEARARELLLDTLGCAISGLRVAEVDGLIARLSATEPGHVSIPGMEERGLSAQAFIWAFGAASCYYEACEGLATAHGRPGLHAVPAALAYGLAGGRSLGDILDAIVLGYELGARLGAVMRIRPGMHVDGTWGSFGAAAAVSRLQGHAPEATMGALAAVACQMPFSLYHPVTMGSIARNLYVGHGAALGAMAAVAAGVGFGGPKASLATCAQLALGRDVRALREPSGSRAWHILDGYLKSYAGTKHVHYGVAAADRWRAEHRGRPLRPERVELRIYGEAMTYCGNRAPGIAIQAQFSLTYGLAWALLRGGLGPEAYDPASLSDPDVRALESRIEVEEEKSFTEQGRRACILKVVSGGETWTGTVDSVLGDPEMPMTRTQVVDKFEAFAGPVLGRERAERVAAGVIEGGLDRPLEFMAQR